MIGIKTPSAIDLGRSVLSVPNRFMAYPDSFPPDCVCMNVGEGLSDKDDEVYLEQRAKGWGHILSLPLARSDSDHQFSRGNPFDVMLMPSLLLFGSSRAGNSFETNEGFI